MREKAVMRCAGALVLIACGATASADEAVGLRNTWTGFYIGAHLGGSLTLTEIDDPFGPSLYGDTVRAPGPIAGGQAGYNWQLGRAVLGVEAEASWADAYGTDTCLAFSGFYVSANCTVDVNAMGAFTGRFGWLIGAHRGTLLYGKAGVAWQRASMDATTAGGAGLPPTSRDAFRWGLALGAGAERALGENWSVSAEYDYRRFGDDNFTTPTGLLQPVPSADPNALTAIASRATDVSQNTHLLRLGLNYRFADPQAEEPHSTWTPDLLPQPVSGISIEVGARYVYGWGRFQKDLGITGMGMASPASRLTYAGMDTNGAEVLARVDLASGLMAKGFIGWGNGGGRLNDEDWGVPFAIFVPYSNTWSKVDDEIRYGIVDVGYDVWRGEGLRVSPFIGYSRFHQYMRGYGCVQLANPHSDCATPIPTSVLGISEDDTWQALRLGAAADVQLVRGVTLSLDAAYLPYVRFSGTDDHVLRSLISPEWANGTGAQLDLMLSYAVTDRFSLGVGGRYWSMWTRDGSVNFGGVQIVPMRYTVEQAALLVQGSYTLDGMGD